MSKSFTEICSSLSSLLIRPSSGKIKPQENPQERLYRMRSTIIDLLGHQFIPMQGGRRRVIPVFEVQVAALGDVLQPDAVSVGHLTYPGHLVLYGQEVGDLRTELRRCSKHTGLPILDDPSALIRMGDDSSSQYWDTELKRIVSIRPRR